LIYLNYRIHAFTPGLRRNLACLASLLLVTIFARGQSISYPTPLCTNGGPVFPIYGPGTPSGGSFSAAGGNLNIIGSTGQINPGLSSPGTYTVSYFAPAPCNCMLTHVVNIYAITPISIKNASVCASTTVSPLIVVASPSTNLSFTWAPSPANTPTLAVFPPYNNQFISLTVKDVNGCTNQTNTTITVFAGPVVNIAGSNTVCSGQSVVLSAFGGSNHQWSTGAMGTNINVQPTSTTVYSVTASNASGCKTTVAHTVNIANLQLTVNNPSVCSGWGATLTAQAVPSNPNTSYFWYPGAISGQQISVAPTTTQTYTLLANSAGCTSSTVAKVTVSPSFTPTANFTYKFPVCTDSPDQAPQLGPGFFGGGNFSAIGPAAIEISPETGVISFSTITAGDYLVLYNLAATGCTAAVTASAMISIGQRGKVELVPEVLVYKGSSVKLTASGGNYYNWTPNEFIDCVNCDTPSVSPPESMEYCVSSDQCLEGGCVKVTVICKNEGDFSVPNAFTPDGDGNNDKFCLQGWSQCVKTFEVLIFDRWGAKLFESDKPDFCWDGVFNGQLLHAGVYTYVITASYDLAPNLVKKGNITILR
jgi:gliding motility-associated-like protein